MANIPDSVVDELIPKFRKGMDIQDRKYLGKTYPQCFVGKDAVTWLTQNSPAKTRKEAVELGNRIMAKGVFEHVVKEHNFKDKEYFYVLLPEKETPQKPSQSSAEKSLYARLGGNRAIAAVVDDFCDRIKCNEVILANPVVKDIFSRTIQPGFKHSVTSLMCQVTGGPEKYHGLGMREAHLGMKITDKEWDAFAADFKATLDKFKVPAKEQGELFALVSSLKPEIVTAHTLYDRLGGIAGIATVVNIFVDKFMSNSVLTANPHLKKYMDATNIPALKYYVTELVAMATGGPQKYTGRSMKAVHKDMKITDKEWDAFAADFKATLDQCKVPSKEQKELLQIVGSLKSDIVINPKPSLYERLGGSYAIALVVDDFVDRVRSDYVINNNPIVREENLKSLPASFKFLVTEFVCEKTGGPQKYTGKSMKEAHKHMKITDREWQQLIALLKQSLDKFKVGVQEQTELISALAPLKNDIVTA
jgi:hemoglobin